MVSISSETVSVVLIGLILLPSGAVRKALRWDSSVSARKQGGRWKVGGIEKGGKTFVELDSERGL
jgi:hypothetical protein